MLRPPPDWTILAFETALPVLSQGQYPLYIRSPHIFLLRSPRYLSNMFRSLVLVPVLYIVLAAPKPLAKPTREIVIGENKEMESKAFPTVEVQDAATPWDLKVENVNEEALAGATPWKVPGATPWNLIQATPWQLLSDEMTIRATPWGLLKKLEQGGVEKKTTWEGEKKSTWEPLEEATPWGLRDAATPWDRVLLPNFEKVTQIEKRYIFDYIFACYPLQLNPDMIYSQQNLNGQIVDENLTPPMEFFRDWGL